MPVLNRLRPVNIKYNDDNRLLPDYTFDMKGENSVAFLQNAGGKTVLIRFFMQTILFNYDKLGKKDNQYFDITSYFKTNNEPAYIMAELELDDNNGYLLIVVGFKRNYDGTLKKVAFVRQYNTPSDKYSLDNFPIFDSTDGFKKLNGIDEMFTKFTSDRKNKEVLCYRSNNSTHRKQFREKLLEYRINEKEWKNIHAKVNSMEGGIASVFGNSKKSKDLLSDWLIPAIEDKLLDDDESKSRLDDIKEALEQHIVNKEQKLEELKDLGEYREFIEDLESMSQIVEERDLNLAKYNIARSNLNHIWLELTNINKELQEKQVDLEKLIGDTCNLISDYKYKSISLEIQDLKIKRGSIESEITSISKEIESLDNKKMVYEKELDIMSAAKIYGEMLEHWAQVTVLENKLKPLNEKLKEYEEKTNNIKYSLRLAYLDELNALEDRYRELVTISETNGTIIEQREIELKETSREIKSKEIAINKCLKVIGAFESAFEDFKSQYKGYEDNLDTETKKLNTYYLDNYLEEVSDVVTDLKEQINEKENILSANRNSITDNRETKRNIETDILKKKQGHENATIEYNNYLEEKQKAVVALEEFGLSESYLFSKETVLLNIEQQIADAKNIERDLILENNELRKDKSFYQNNKITLSNEIILLLKEYNIDFLYGFDFIKNFGGSYEVKQNLLRINPLIPYSIIVDKKDYKKMENILCDKFTDNIVPILIREELDSVGIVRSNSLFSVGNFALFGGYNEKLIDERYIQTIIERIDMKISSNLNKIKSINEKVSTLINLSDLLNRFKYTKDTESNLINKIDGLVRELDILEREGYAIDDSISHLEDLNEILVSEINDLRIELDVSNSELNAVAHIRKIYDRYSTELDRVGEFTKEKNALEDRLNETTKSKEEATKNKAYADSKKGTILEEINLLKVEGNEYITYEGVGTRLTYHDGSYIGVKQLEEQLVECKNTGEYNDVNHLKEEISSNMSKAKSLELELESLNINLEEYKDVKFSSARITEIKEDIKELSKLRDSRIEGKGSKKAELDSTNKSISKKERQCFKEFSSTYIEEYIERKDYLLMAKEEETLINKNEDSLKAIIKDVKIITKYIEKLDDFKNFIIDNGVNLEEVNRDNFEEVYDKYKDMYNSSENIMERLSNKINAKMSSAFVRYESSYRNRKITKMLQVLSKIKLSKENIDTLVYKIKQYITQLEGAEKNIENQFNAICDVVTPYADKLFEELRQIDKSSIIDGKKMFWLTLPKEGNPVGVKDFLNNVVDLATRDAEKRVKILRDSITSYNILDSLIMLDTVKAHALKINATGVTKPIRYEDTHNDGECSGAQRTIIAFVIIQCMLHYTNDKVISDSKKTSGFIFLDNPFAPLTTDDYLGLFFDIAKKFKTQMFCWTDISKPAIIKQFKNIFTMHIVTRGKKEYLEIDDNSKQNNEVILTSGFTEDIE